MKYSKEDIFRMVEEEDVEFIRLQFTDIFGVLKNMAVTVSQLEKILDNQCMFDGSSIEARLICDIYLPDGRPFAGDPRYILKKVLNEAKDMGYSFFVGPECEFFLFHTDEEGRPIAKTQEVGSYFDISPLDMGENVRRDIVLNLEDMGFCFPP